MHLRALKQWISSNYWPFYISAAKFVDLSMALWIFVMFAPNEKSPLKIQDFLCAKFCPFWWFFFSDIQRINIFCIFKVFSIFPWNFQCPKFMTPNYLLLMLMLATLFYIIMGDLSTCWPLLVPSPCVLIMGLHHFVF